MSRIDFISIMMVAAFWGYACPNVPALKSSWDLFGRIFHTLF